MGILIRKRSGIWGQMPTRGYKLSTLVDATRGNCGVEMISTSDPLRKNPKLCRSEGNVNSHWNNMVNTGTTRWNTTNWNSVLSRINELSELIKERRNIHKNIKAQIRGIKLLHIRVVEQKNAKASSGKVTWETQVTPLPCKTRKRSRDRVSELPGAQQAAKKKQASSWKKAEPAKFSDKVCSSFMTIPTFTKEEESAVRKSAKWQRQAVRSGKRKKKTIRSEITIIFKKEDLSYADILRKAKVDPEFTDLGGSVNRIGPTEKGDLILKLIKSSG